MSIDPTSGPVGTQVEIVATGCGDDNGLNHAVSFNPDLNEDPNPNVRAVDATLAGQTIHASYTITAADAEGSGDGAFFVQCATDLQQANFTITK